MSKNCILKLIIILFVVATFLSCGEEKKAKELPFKTQKEYEQTMIKSHQYFLQKEKEKINHYIDSLGFSFISTGTGLRYYIYEKNIGDSLKSGESAVINYILTSIEGDTLYISPKNQVQEFLVDYDNVERGLHEGIKNMRVGEKGIFILPAHLAHGITGDQAAIPTQTTLVYDIHLLAKR